MLYIVHACKTDIATKDDNQQVPGDHIYVLSLFF